MQYEYSTERPQLVTTRIHLGQPIYTVNTLVEEIQDEYYKYRYISIELPQNTWNKDVIISGLIKAKYTSDIMDAVRNNYELVRDGTAGDKTQEYTDEYLAMQEWRRYVKELASEIMEEYERQHG